MKPRCQGAKTPGHFTSFECVLDDNHDGFCEPYVAPTVDEWRARMEWEDEVVVSLERIQVLVHRIDDARVSFRQECMELRASAAEDVETIQMARAILESGCDACAHSAPKHPVSQEATLAEMRGALDDDGRDLDAETVAGVQAARDDLRGLAGKVET